MIDALVLDVGHAGCTIIRSPDRVVVVDAGKTLVLEALDALGVTHVDHLILTHRHRDHTSGAYALLSSKKFSVGRLYVNPHPSGPDSKRITRAVNLAWKTHRTVKQDVNETTTADLTAKDLSIEVLWPNIEHSNEGVGGQVQNRNIGAHELAVVTRISAWGGRSVLLCADAEHGVLDALIASVPEKLKADALVYPHHGGHSLTGASSVQERDFAERLTRAVDPEVVIFSNGRTQFNNPRTEVITGVRAAGARIRIACTQINTRCGDPVPNISRALPGHGTSAGHSCAGSIDLALDTERPLDPRLAEHVAVIASLATAECS